MKRQSPKTLSRKAGIIFKEIQHEYGIEDSAGCLLLQAALESWDIQQEALKSIKEDGILISGSHETLKKNPAVQIWRKYGDEMSSTEAETEEFLRSNAGYVVTPERAFGMIETPEDFGPRATRWRW